MRDGRPVADSKISPDRAKAPPVRAPLSADDLLQLLDSRTPSIIYVRQIGEKPRVVYINEAYERAAGRPRQVILDDFSAWVSSIHPEDRVALLDSLEHVWESGEPHDVTFRIIRPDGAVRWIRNRTLIGEVNGVSYAVGVADDVTESRRSREMLTAQHRVLESIAHGEPLGVTLRLLCEVIESLAPDTRASILTLDDDRKTMRHAAGPNLPDDYISAVDGLEIGPNVGSCGAAMCSGELVVVENVDVHPNLAPIRDFSREQGIKACWSNPVFASNGSVLGSFALYPDARRGPTGEELELLDTASHLAAIALERDQHERALRRANEMLEAAVRSRTTELRKTNSQLEDEMRERQAATNALAESELRFRSIVQSVPGAVYRCKLDADWTMIFLSEGVEALTGYPADDFIDSKRRTWAEIIHPDDRVKTERIVEDAITARKPFALDYRVLHRDGSIRWVFERGRAVWRGDEIECLDGAILDITLQHEMQDAIRESEQRFRRLADEAPILVWMTDQDQNCEFCNRAWLEFTGRDITSELGGGWLERLDEQQERRILKQLQFEGTPAPFQMEVTMRRHDGAQRVMLVHGSPRFAADATSDGAGGFIGTAVDITEMREVEEAARRRETELAHALRLATVGEMATAIAHELNQPLTSISNYATGAMRRLQHGEITTGDLSSVLREVDELARRGGQIIRRVRSLVQQRTPRRGETNPVEIIEHAIKMLSADIEEANATVKLTLKSESESALVDAVEFEQVMVNLLRNALDEIRLVEPNRRTIEIQYSLTPDHTIAIDVIDQGRGLQLDASDVFEPFRTTKLQGMGLGLAISRSIVEAHGGDLTYHHEEPTGSRFRITLPSRRDAPGAEGQNL